MDIVAIKRKGKKKNPIYHTGFIYRKSKITQN